MKFLNYWMYIFETFYYAYFLFFQFHMTSAINTSIYKHTVIMTSVIFIFQGWFVVLLFIPYFIYMVQRNRFFHYNGYWYCNKLLIPSNVQKSQWWDGSRFILPIHCKTYQETKATSNRNKWKLNDKCYVCIR